METKTRSRLWERLQIKPSKLHDEEPVAAYSTITVYDLRGTDALLEKLQKVHGRADTAESSV